MNIPKFLKKQALILSLAMANVEKDIIRNTGDSISNDIKGVQRHKQGYLSDDLLQGILSEEVIMMRARLYKVMNATDNLRRKRIDSSIVGEPSDRYPVEISMVNRKTIKSLEELNIEGDKEPVALNFIRDFLPRFRLEDYTEKFYVKTIDEETKLIELFVNKYNQMNNKKTSFFLKSLERAKEAPRTSDILDILTINFISEDALGVSDFLEFKYDIINFDKIIEFEEHYIIKFKCKEIISGRNIFEKYANNKVDYAYDNNLPRPN